MRIPVFAGFAGSVAIFWLWFGMDDMNAVRYVVGAGFALAAEWSASRRWRTA